MNSSKDTGSQASTSALLIDGNVTSSISLKNGILEAGKQVDGDEAAKQAILRYSGQHVSTFWWFRKVNLKFGSVRFAVSNGSILLTALVLLAYYFMRRKKYTITSILKGQAQFVKKTVIDLWQLAFSYQVNPLAAVEPLQTPTRISR
nr:protein APEM9 [Tanacetum cinerariifolium]